MISLLEIGKNAKECQGIVSNLSENQKNMILNKISESLLKNIDEILKANLIDIENAKRNNIRESLIDRLMLNTDRIKSIANGVLEVAHLKDPIGEVIHMSIQKNGLKIGKQRVPLGVIGIIYEARPNVTVESMSLCLKSGNVVILRGGSDAINSNIKIVEVIQEAISQVSYPKNLVQLITDNSREVAKEFMRLNKFIDVLIPRGGSDLIKTVVENSNIPVIETGTGNCHVYVDEFYDKTIATKIVIDAKTNRVSVCNSCESLLVSEKIAVEIIPEILGELRKHGVEIRACERTIEIYENCILATNEDYATEFLDYIISVKIVKDINEAIKHINEYGTKHSDAIITTSYDNAWKFLKEVDSAAVYVNASTRFTDGMEFGLGSEIGISTQKLHARGPMGLNELTTTKYIIFGNGQTKGKIF